MLPIRKQRKFKFPCSAYCFHYFRLKIRPIYLYITKYDWLKSRYKMFLTLYLRRNVCFLKNFVYCEPSDEICIRSVHIVRKFLSFSFLGDDSQIHSSILFQFW